jgi:small-conductance mechanosensitive channel/CRP-like cAMP-binding protein
MLTLFYSASFLGINIEELIAFRDYPFLIFLIFVSTIFLYTFIWSIGKFLKDAAKVPLGFEYHLFAVSTALFLSIYYMTPNLWDIRLFITITSIFFFFVVYNTTFRVIEKYSITEHIPEILQDIFRILLVLLLGVFVIENVYDISIPGLFASAGVASIVVGLALQETLKDLISGLVIHFSRSIMIGDWLKFDQYEGQVIGMNWRSTLLRDLDGIILEVPNNQLTTSQVTNFHHKDPLHSDHLRLHINIHEDPLFVKDLLLKAARDAPHVEKYPLPEAELCEITENTQGIVGSVFKIHFWIKSRAYVREARNELLIKLWHLLKEHQIQFCDTAVAGREESYEDFSYLTKPHIEKFFSSHNLENLNLDSIAKVSKLKAYFHGEEIIHQGGPPISLFLIVRGKAEAILEKENKKIILGQLHPEQCFGENAILGAPRQATVRCLNHCQVVEIPLKGVEILIKEHPQTVELFGELLAQKHLQQMRATHQMECINEKEFIEEEKKSIIESLKEIFWLNP